MALKEMTLYGEIDKELIAIQRLKELTPKDRKAILGFSGGKDSQVIYDLAIRAGIDFEAQCAPTPDPPELIRFRRKYYPEVREMKCNKFTSRQAKGRFTGRPKTIFNLIASRKMPPTRMARYCCSELKENTGEIGDTIITGVRREESNGRSSRKIVEYYQGKIILNPIVDWTAAEIWEYIYSRNLPYCELYDQGFTRLGCIGCPLGTNQEKEFAMYPKYKENYIRAFDKMLLNLDLTKCEWQTGQDVYDWWIAKTKEKPLEGQCSMF